MSAKLECDIPIKEEIEEESNVVECYDEIYDTDEIKNEIKEESLEADENVNKSLDIAVRNGSFGLVGNCKH